MSENKPPERIWVEAWDDTSRVPVEGWPLYVSAAVLRGLVEKWEKLNEQLHLRFPYEYAGYYYDAAQELEQLLEGGK